jgi:hypothetical protein
MVIHNDQKGGCRLMESKAVRVIIGGLSCLSTWSAMGATGAECPDIPKISAQTQERLVTYIGHRYELPAFVALAMEETGVQVACYRQIKVFSRSPAQPFEVALYISRDEKVLAPDLLMLWEDPTKERETAANRLQQRLADNQAASMGSREAPVSIVMFTDFECEYCRRAAEVIEQEILPGKKDKVRFTVRHHPLPAQELKEMIYSGKLMTTSSQRSVN